MISAALPSYRKPLGELLLAVPGAGPLPGADIMVEGMTLDSRRVKPGYLFMALPGAAHDGRRFVADAVTLGAVAVLAEAGGDEVAQDNAAPDQNQTVPTIEVENLAAHLSAIAGVFYDHPSRKVSVIGITGTNGKSSCAYMAAQALTDLGHDCGVVGTLGYGIPGQLEQATHTTPNPIEVQRIIADIADSGAQAVAMEVSSHGLDQGRVSDIAFDTGLFTNLSRDHLDYHGDMDSYAAAKARLFKQPGMKSAVLNLDDAYGAKWAQQLAGDLDCYGYGLNGKADVYVNNVQLSGAGISADLYSPWGEGELRSPLIGRFNLSNLLAVFTLLCVQGVSCEEALATLSKLENLPGRMQRLGGDGTPTVVVDFAHTPDALETALSTLRELTDGRLWCVFGCGGDRDQGKRPLMGRIAEQLADQVVVTSDNPRSESPELICSQILAGMAQPDSAMLELERSVAIGIAVTNATSQDIVLIAGKGHENYQLIGADKITFSDLSEAQAALTARTGGTA